MFVVVVCVLHPTSHAGTLKLGDIVRFKGQETNTLQGLGLVVGLSGTGDADALPTARALSRMMQLMGGPVGTTPTGMLDLNDVADARNVAMVFVTATVPAVGAQAGDHIDVEVHAINAKSLRGGTLMLTPMLGPRSDSPVVYAMAQGGLQISDNGPLTSGTIEGGGKIETTIPAAFVENNRVTLILKQDFASFDTAQRIEDEINNLSSLTLGSEDFGTVVDRRVAQAKDQLHIQVEIPSVYQDSPIKFIWYLMNIPIRLSGRDNRVVINEREGVVVIGSEVEVAPVLITHRNLRIEAAAPGLVPVANPSDLEANAKLKDLADALSALDVPTVDLIAIIKTLQAKGDLFGEVVYR